METDNSHSNPAPVALFCFNRPGHLKQTLASLQANHLAQATPLFVFSDGPRHASDHPEVDKVRSIAEEFQGMGRVEIIKREQNYGLARSIIKGVSEVIRKYGRCIVLEDDLELSPFFLVFMNQALQIYETEQSVFSISGYCPPIRIPRHFAHEAFRFQRINSWGWGTWANRWEKVDWDVSRFNHFIHDRNQIKELEKQGKDLPVMLLKQQTGQNNSWAVRFNQACFENGMTNIYPVNSLVRNRGADNSGTHMKASRKFSVSLAKDFPEPYPAVSDPQIDASFRKFYHPSLYRQTINRLKILRYRFSHFRPQCL